MKTRHRTRILWPSLGLATIATAASRPTARRVCRLTERPRACSGRRDITGSARGRGRRVEGFNEIDRP